MLRLVVRDHLMGRRRASKLSELHCHICQLQVTMRRSQDLEGIMGTPESTTLHTHLVATLLLTTNHSSCVGGGGPGPVISRLPELPELPEAERQQSSMQTDTCKVCSNSQILCTSRQHQLASSFASQEWLYRMTMVHPRNASKRSTYSYACLVQAYCMTEGCIDVLYSTKQHGFLNVVLHLRAKQAALWDSMALSGFVRLICTCLGTLPSVSSLSCTLHNLPSLRFVFCELHTCVAPRRTPALEFCLL